MMILWLTSRLLKRAQFNMEQSFDTDGTSFTCPKCGFKGSRLSGSVSHSTESRSEGLSRISLSYVITGLQTQQTRMAFQSISRRAFRTENHRDVNECPIRRYIFHAVSRSLSLCLPIEPLCASFKGGSTTGTKVLIVIIAIESGSQFQ